MSKMKIAKPGFDVSNTDYRNFLFNQNNIFKIAYTGNLSVSYTVDSGLNGSGEAIFTHNLGYVPIAFAINTDYGAQIPLSAIGSGTSLSIYYKMTSTNFYVEVQENGGYSGPNHTHVTWNFRYQIMYDKII